MRVPATRPNPGEMIETTTPFPSEQRAYRLVWYRAHLTALILVTGYATVRGIDETGAGQNPYADPLGNGLSTLVGGALLIAAAIWGCVIALVAWGRNRCDRGGSATVLRLGCGTALVAAAVSAYLLAWLFEPDSRELWSVRAALALVAVSAVAVVPWTRWQSLIEPHAR